MKIKTIKAFDLEQFDFDVNAFEKIATVKFIQTHVTVFPNAEVQYTAVIFYEA